MGVEEFLLKVLKSIQKDKDADFGCLEKINGIYKDALRSHESISNKVFISSRLKEGAMHSLNSVLFVNLLNKLMFFILKRYLLFISYIANFSASHH